MSQPNNNIPAYTGNTTAPNETRRFPKNNLRVETTRSRRLGDKSIFRAAAKARACARARTESKSCRAASLSLGGEKNLERNSERVPLPCFAAAENWAYRFLPSGVYRICRD